MFLFLLLFNVGCFYVAFVRFKLSDDGKFGTLNQIDGTWTGMMGELVTRQVRAASGVMCIRL